MPSLIKDRLQQNQTVSVMSISTMATPKLVEAASYLSHVQGVWFDQEHCALTHSQIELLAMAARSGGLDCFTRVAPTDYGAVMRPMEAGCSGVMAAQVRTAEEVSQIVSWAKFAPQGGRGTFGANPESKYGIIPVAEYIEMANRDRWLAIQIETLSAVEQVDEIAAVEGVDLLFIGPNDLSVNLGVPGDMLNPKCVDVLERVGQAAQKAGIAWGALCPTLEHARQCRDLGCQLFSLLGDTGCFRRGITALEETFAEFFE